MNWVPGYPGTICQMSASGRMALMTFDFGKKLKFSRQAMQAVQTSMHDIVLLHKNTVMCVCDITFKCIIMSCVLFQNTVS